MWISGWERFTCVPYTVAMILQTYATVSFNLLFKLLILYHLGYYSAIIIDCYIIECKNDVKKKANKLSTVKDVCGFY